MKRFLSQICCAALGCARRRHPRFHTSSRSSSFSRKERLPGKTPSTSCMTAFTSTIARGLSLVAIVVAGLTFAFGEGGSKRVLAGVLFGVGMAIAAVNFSRGFFRELNQRNRRRSTWSEPRRINRVHRSLSRPLTILGAERKLFFFAMCLGAATFNLLNSLFGGLLMFLLLYFMARWATQTDPQILRFLLTAARLRAEYDPMKFTPIAIRRDGHAQA